MPAIALTQPPPRPSRTLDLVLAIAALSWFLAARELSSRSASGIAQRLNQLALASLLQPLFLLFLLLVGFSLLDTVCRRRSTARDLLGLPSRPTAPREWAAGAALGWGAIVLVVLSIALFGQLHVQLWTEPRAFLYALFTVTGIAVYTLALEVTFRGYVLRRLLDSFQPTVAMCLVALMYALLFAFSPGATVFSTLVIVLLSLLLGVAWLRTHALWLGWGLNFAWTASLGLLFGLPLAGSTELSSVIQTTAFGPRPLTGGAFGPEASNITVPVLLIAFPVLYRLTRDFAWHYTHRTIVSAGYAMDVPPPEAHNAAAKAPAAPPPLVQILPSTPQQRSASDTTL